MTIETLQHPAAHPASAGPAPTITTLQRNGGNDEGSLGLWLMISGIITILVTLIVLYRFFYVQQQLKSFSVAITSAQTQYQTLQPIETKANDIKALADALTATYKSQLSYTTLLKQLETSTYSSAVYDSVAIDTKGKVVLTGKVATYLDFAKTVKSFKEKNGDAAALTNDVAIGAVGQTQQDQKDGTKKQETTFSINFTLAPSYITQAVAHPAATTTTTTTTTTTGGSL